MTRRNYIRLCSFMAFALSVLIAMAIVNTRNMNSYKRQLEVSYQGSLNELNECLNTVNTDLTKSIYSNSDTELYNICKDLYSQCSVAKNAVSRLPISQMELGNVYKFLSQASDYSQFIANKLEKKQTVSEKEHKTLLTLLSYANKFSSSTEKMVSIVSSGAKITDGKVKNTSEISITPLSNTFSEGAKAFESFPTLLYDGPFSDQILNKKSKLVANAEIKTKEECKTIAAKALGVNENRVTFDSDEKSKLACYTFKSGRYTISVTKQGGFIKSILYSGVVSNSNIKAKDAIAYAQKYLNKLGYKNMKQSYYTVADNICTINFAYTKGNVYYYSDLIKVSVSMENGKIVALEAQTYLTNHTNRNSFTHSITIEEAQKKLSPYLNVNSKKPCVIPKENGSEVNCYEFSCTSKETGEDALIYINSSSGNEEDIMLLLYTDNGTLVK